MRKYFKRNWTYLVLSFVITILLFLYVNGTQAKNSDSMIFGNRTHLTLTANKSDSFSVPLSLSVDSNSYFVTGYPEKVKIHITGPSALVTTTANTRIFKAYADLSKLGVGKHRVRVKQEGLNSELKYQFTPATIDVDIQPRKTVTYPISVAFDKSNIAAGYVAGKPTTDVKNVKITGALNQINQINRVVAQLNIPRNENSNVNNQAIIEALDSNGNTVNVVITPATADVSLPITPGNNKELPIKLKPKGTTSSSGSFSLKANINKVRVFGTNSQLDQIKSVIVQVDTSGVTNTKTKDIQLDSKLNNVKGFDPSDIQVTITKK